jgi:hypothetical protein
MEVMREATATPEETGLHMPMQHLQQSTRPFHLFAQLRPPAP